MIIPFSFLIIRIGFFQNLLFIGKFQKMVCFMIFVKAGIHKILFSLGLAVIAVRSHQIPVDFLLHHIFRYGKRILASADIIYNVCLGTAFLQHFPECGLLMGLPASTVPFGNTQPSYLFLMFLYSSRIFPRKITTPPQLVASIMILLTPPITLSGEVSIKQTSCNGNCVITATSCTLYDNGDTDFRVFWGAKPVNQAWLSPLILLYSAEPVLPAAV